MPPQPTYYQPMQQPTQQMGMPFQPAQNTFHSASYNNPYPAPTYAPQRVTNDSQKSSLSTAILVWGILSLAFSVTSLSLLGFIFSFVAKSKVKRYLTLYGEPEGRANVGRGLAKAGFIVGLIMTILLIISAILMILEYILMSLFYVEILSDLLDMFQLIIVR